MVGFFTAYGDLLVAEELAVSQWASDQLGGHAICGLLARGLETHCATGFIPTRMTVDLFRPVANAPLRVCSTMAHRDERQTIADASIVQNGQPRVRATAVFLPTGAIPPGRVWQPASDLPVPPRGCVSPNGSPPLFKSGDREWSRDFVTNQNADRKISWHSLPPLVTGEPITPFQRAALLGDTTNLVCHWGSRGAGYINVDMTLTLARLPRGYELGLRADHTVAADGISIGVATLYDRDSAVGTCVVTALANPLRQIDFTTVFGS
ncbi:acyl-CoA thioesterase domain-containing protein [Nocardia paucivorans]|uniref:acyl-CoA thioesterase domain-containing protein n=1 Tax=Nocardia paucivorans TaxID=114259 RepID=UPI0002D99C94|nr:acyl-CoA thioesterase domain-containing protein [Nocardia paucivorans]